MIGSRNDQTYYRKKKVLITGGNSGFGKALVSQLIRFGADVAMIARNRSKNDKVLVNLTPILRNGQKLLAFPLDISDEKAISDMIPEVIKALGGIDILINNAGFAHPGYFENIPSKMFQKMMEVNYFGSINVTRLALPFLKKSRGHVSFVSSMNGQIPTIGFSAYVPTKFAITGFVECLRQELLGYKIDTSIIYPSDIDTPLLQYENQFKPEETKKLTTRIKPMKAETLSDRYLKAISSGKMHIYPNRKSWFICLVNRLSPGLVRFFIDRAIKS